MAPLLQAGPVMQEGLTTHTWSGGQPLSRMSKGLSDRRESLVMCSRGFAIIASVDPTGSM